MSIRGKKILSLVTYYTLLAMALIMASISIVYCLNRELLPNWAKILYILWSIAVIATLIFDVMCTLNKNMKFISGMLVYILSIVSVIVTAILYLTRSTLTAGLAATFMPVYTGIAAIILSTSIYMIATFIVGEAVSEHKSALQSIKNNKN